MTRDTVNQDFPVSGANRWRCLKSRSRSFLLLTCMEIVPAVVCAQAADPVNAARLRVGPFGVTPSITLSTGIDTNVLAEPANPKTDLMTIASPRVGVWLRPRRVILELRNATDVIGFRQYQAQGGFNTRNEVRVDVPLNRLRLFAGHSFTTTEQRASIEIDARARRRETNLNVGADIRATSKLFVRVGATHAVMAFADDASNLGVNLAEALNRRLDVGTAALRYQLTGATTLAFSADAARERFDLAPTRDSTSLRIAPGVEFDPRAILSGRAYVGIRRFTITSGLAPTYTGPVAAVELSSVIRGATRLGVVVNRDVAYSFDVTTPYYLLSGGGGTVSRRLGERWEFAVNAGRQNLLYRSNILLPANRTGVPAEVRRDFVNTYGGSITYLFSPTMRFGFGIDHAKRHSGLNQRGYEGTRFLAQFGYGS